jgi:hypothetical protein
MEWLIGFLIVILALFGVIVRKPKDIFDPLIAIIILEILFF